MFAHQIFWQRIMNISQASKIIKGRIKKHPLWLTHVITYTCNARCEMCARWQKEHDSDKELSKQECFNLIDNASQAGILFYTMYGGEPLVYKDAPDVLAYAKSKNLLTAINTNGFFLKDRINEVALYTDSIIVSIDSVGKKHDEMRKLPGLFDKAVEGIIASKTKVKLSINSVITAENKESVPHLINLSNELKVPIFIQPIVRSAGYNDHLMLSKEEEKNLYKQLISYKTKENRLLNSTTYIKNLLYGKVSNCHAPKVYIRIEGDGTIGFCNNKEWGNIRDTQLADVFRSSAFKYHCKNMETCTKCVSACTDISKLYNNPFYSVKIASEYLRNQK